MKNVSKTNTGAQALRRQKGKAELYSEKAVYADEPGQGILSVFLSSQDTAAGAVLLSPWESRNCKKKADLCKAETTAQAQMTWIRAKMLSAVFTKRYGSGICAKKTNFLVFF